MKKQGILMKVMVLILTLTFIASIATTTALANQGITVTIDGVPVTFTGTQPQIVDGRTLVPARGVFEHLGFDVEWNGALQRVTMTRPGQQVILTIGQASFTLVTSIASSHQLDVPAQIINGSTMLPLRAVIEAVGYTLDWDGPTQTVIIVTDDMWNFTSDDEPAATKPPVAPVTITRNGETKAIGDETGVHILARVLLTQAEIQSLLPHARTPEETRMSPHPNRAMTAAELTAWNEEYDNLGGMNRFELEVLYRHNEIRAEHNLPPFALCPALNRAARLHTNLRADGLPGVTGHDDPFYGANDPVHGQPLRGRVFLFNSTLTDRPRSLLSENAGGGATSSGAVNSWMASAAHRGQILHERWEDAHIGIGNTGNFATAKFNAVLGR